MGDAMCQQPLVCTVGEESWRQKEARAPVGIPEEWGEFATRAVIWEAMTASTLLQAGADIVVLRHPRAVSATRLAIAELMADADAAPAASAS